MAGIFIIVLDSDALLTTVALTATSLTDASLTVTSILAMNHRAIE